MSLDLANNEFTGELDADVGKLTNLGMYEQPCCLLICYATCLTLTARFGAEILKLELNFLSGSFPDGLRSLKKLSE